MPKKLRLDPIYIAPDIIGWKDKEDNIYVFDERTHQQLNPTNINDKIKIYERQVKDWFLNPATNLIKYKNKNKGFIVLMICLSYLEGVEKYRLGRNERYGYSKCFFVNAMQRIYPNQFNSNQLEDFYREARCGLFHNGMVDNRLIIDDDYERSLIFDGNDIKVSPAKFLNDIKDDFDNYISELATNQELRNNFNGMYTNL